MRLRPLKSRWRVASRCLSRSRRTAAPGFKARPLVPRRCCRMDHIICGVPAKRRVKDLVGAFAQFPHLPKMLNRKAILDTLVGGCMEGMFVLRLTRADRSIKTFWRDMPDDTALRDSSI